MMLQNDSQQSSRDSNRVGELDIENRKLRTELEEFRKEFQEVKNQEVTIRRLEDKIADYETKVIFLPIFSTNLLRFKPS
jgi:hypothetical protein